MKMTYQRDTLYIDIIEGINPALINNLKHRLFSIIDDYDIDNIVLNVINKDYNHQLLDILLDTYDSKYTGNLVIK